MKTLTSRRAVFAASVLAVLATSNCGGGNIPKAVGVAAGNISGVAIKGPVVAGVVKILKMSATMERGDELASGTTDAAGAFSLPLPIYNGPLLVVVSSGTYTEEAIGLGVKLDGHELTALIPDYKGGAKLEGVRATPISTLAVAFTSFHVAHDSKPVVDAYNEAILHLHKQFGDIDWTAVSPADMSVAGVTNLSPEAKAGLVLSGLSWESKVQAETSGVTAGLSLNAATLMSALIKDARDGTLDGKAGTDFIKQGSVTLTGSATRVDLVQGITGFVNSPRNASSLTLADIAGFVAGIGGSNDAYLYCPNQTPTAECGSGVVDTTTPVVTWQLPLHDNSGVAGSVTLRVVAEDETGLKRFQFTTPASLKDIVATIDGKRAVLNATFDVSALPDGPVSVRAEATDTSGNPSAKAITVVVSNKGPIITISAPGEGTLVKNTVVVTASAQAQSVGGVITALTLVDAPMGLGQDTLAAADSFSSQWDSTLSLEGSVTLTFRATDSFNTTTEKSMTVNVDNVPAGVVTASLSAGAPVSGATVRLIAIDDATGLPTTSRGGVGGAELGSSMPTDAHGQVTFTLTGENWNGPVQLVASGTALSFVDPSDGVTPISVPSTYKFSSFRSHYKTGDTLAAPITLWTGLADAAAVAYAQGKNPSAPSQRPLKDALAVTDPLFAGHVSRPTVWDLRSVNPVSLTTGPTQSLRDVVYAAAPDVSLSTLARALSIRASVTPGGVITAITLATQLGEDLRSDGQLDGKALGAQLVTAGSPSYPLDANTTRFQQAISFDAFVRSSNNETGLTKADILAGGLYDNISTDVSLLYPASQPPIPLGAALLRARIS